MGLVINAKGARGARGARGSIYAFLKASRSAAKAKQAIMSSRVK